MKIKKILLLICVAATGLLFNSCSKEAVNAAGNADTGKGGSLTRFTITGDYLYAVDNHFLYAYSLSDPGNPAKVYTSPINFDIETIYPYNNYLFLGTKTGLYIYDLAKPEAPALIGEAKHARSCDPVVANDSVAFVTLKSSSGCGPATSGLYIHDIRSIQQPVLKATVPLPDPVGLGLQDSVLYVCCGQEGLKVFNVKTPYTPVLLSTQKDGDYIDVIPYNNLLICFVKDGILLYDINDAAKPLMVRKIAG